MTNVAVVGAAAYDAARLAQLTRGLVGPDVTLARIDDARTAILNLYRRDGYLFTTVNATIDDGRLTYVVTEGRIAEVKLDGDIGPAGVQVLRFLDHLTREQPVNESSLERWILLAQEVPGVTLHAVLQASGAAPGALTLVAQLSRQPVSGLLTVDDRAYALTGPVESLGVFDLNSLTSFGERTELSLYHTSGDTQDFGQISTEAYAGASGLKIRLYAGAGLATPSAPLRDIGYRGYTTLIGVSSSYPLIRTRRQSLDVSTYFDVEESEVKADTGPQGQRARIGRDSLRVLRAGADYTLQDLLIGAPRPGLDTLQVRLSQGVGSADDGAGSPSRSGERPDFTKIGMSATRTQTLFSPWPAANVALKGLLAGQYSGDVLPPAEKFYLGGALFNRGFYSGQVTGDSALAATAELQLNTGLDLAFRAFPIHVGAQFYGFYDWGETWESQRTDLNHRLRSTGAGVRLFLTQYTEFDVEGVSRITRTPQGTQGAVPPLHADAVYWRVLARF